MAEWIVTYTSMPIEAQTAEDAIARDCNGGGHWQAYPLHVDRPEVFDLEVETIHGDADLPVLTATLGPAQVHAYQHRDEDDQPLPVLVVEVDVDEGTEVRVYVNDAPRTP
ncbi:hypothetical protein Xcel_3383 (plasmid) [Xylanimonas cellulosilytica DSM 15894]|uniref:Uncharacterized protein n=1 Tax=Xylanimonas cellulosilytica (strain DSM 15894 / JCM 12276 / CECT 5975 / KCTC 9989 / LMG 20990 / NBRC 107835 / XIL07) TaxID=446471 RepID=D1C0R6_XYLCX|nr:hypothetical protein [Xylanimonas cellulosilytica]ACZ32382.1 hypothetical protein Xcel_3383 [Xylanimonas cellulosilytica DSM 15894]